MREDTTGDYELFVVSLVPMVTNLRWSRKEHVMCRKEFCKAATTTDECFAILIFENNCHVWLYEYNKKVACGEHVPGTKKRYPLLPGSSVVHTGGVVSPSGDYEIEKEQDTNKPSPMYTKIEQCNGVKHQRWSDQGLHWFNELEAMVMVDRKKNPSWDAKFLAWHKSFQTAKGGKSSEDIQDQKKYVRPTMNMGDLFVELPKVVGEGEVTVDV